MKCEIMDKCGGCLYQHDDYPKSLKEKQKYLERLFEDEKVGEIVGIDNPYYYRNKVHDAFSFSNKEILMGKYEGNSHRVIEVDSCFIEDIQAQKINKTVKELAKSFKWTIYDEDTEYGLLRGTLVRVGKSSKEVLLTIIVTDLKIPSKNNFTKAIREKHPEITSIVFNINDRKTSFILGKKDIVAYGKGYIFDKLLGFKFRISSQSFYQVNVKMTEMLYKKAIELAELTNKETVVDAYCGIGTISLYVSQYAKEVLGVEGNPEAVKDAIYNAKINGIKNVYFTAMDAGEYLNKLYGDGQKIDVLIVDPSRSGLDENAIEGILNLGVEKIVYVSCNPEALKEDLKRLKEKYKVKGIYPFDMFPWTSHVETVCLMSSK